MKQVCIYSFSFNLFKDVFRIPFRQKSYLI